MSRTAVVTGAAGGIGLAVANRLVNDGYEVWGLDIKRPSCPTPRFHPVTADLADPSAPTRFFSDHFTERPLVTLVNAAGVAFFGSDESALHADEALWESTLGINFHGSRRMSAAGISALRRGQGASIVNIASIAGLRNMDSPMDAYQTSKAAVVALSHSLALQLGPEGIRVNTVCPGAILTPMIEYLYEEDPTRRTRMEQKTPLRRLGRPEDVAAAVAWLASEDASFITGTDLVVDGGWSSVTV